MPIVRIELWEGRTLEQKDALIREVTKAVCDTIGVTPEDVVVVLQEVSKDHWGVAGKRGGG